jgi:curved DNA-binding protein CbpA
VPPAEDHYATLNVSPDATPEELRQARNQLLLFWHPDRSRDPAAPERAKRINAAYAVLSDPAGRAAYDRERAATHGVPPRPPAGPPPPRSAGQQPSRSAGPQTPSGRAG